MSIFSIDDNAVSAAKLSPDGKTQGIPETASIAPSFASSEMTTNSTRPQSITIAGNRAAEAFIRPAPIYTVGTLLKYGFDLARVTFELKLEAEESTKENAPTEIFVPPLHFPKDQMSVTVSDGKWEYNEQSRILKWWHDKGQQTIKIVGVKTLSVEVEDENLALQLCDKVCSIM